MNIIETQNLTKTYGDFTAVSHLNLHIRKGSVYGFLGPNGAGKSTTMKMFLDIDAQLLQGIDHLPLLNFDRNFSFRLALVDYNRQIEFIRRNLHLGTSVHLNITRESLLGLSEHRRSQYDRRR